MLTTTLMTAMALSQGAPSAGLDTQDVPPRQIQALRSDAPIKVDGRADDAVWQRGEAQGKFKERTPDLGAVDPRDTSVRIAYDDQALYILIQGQLSADKPLIRTLRRDANSIWSDDTVTVKIDPAHDLRSCMLFAANLAGSQTDGMGLNDGADYAELDAVWEVEGHQEGRTFGLEYKIPWYALGVRGRDKLTLGINISRDDPHRSAVYDWRLIVPPRSPMSATSFGSVDLEDALKTRPMVEIVPYALARTDFRPRFSADPRKGPNVAGGLDARIQTGPGGYVEASVLTDFSQVDLDEVQVAGNRFRLYYPERRAFFINGLDVFNFGYEGEGQLFFSRRIGLDGLVSPIAGGVKAYGRSERLSYGVLNVQTLSSYSFEDGNEALMRQPENFSVARLRVQTLPQLAVGFMGVGRKRMRGQQGDAIQGGLDFELRSNDTRFRGYGFVAGAWSEGEPNKDATGAPLPAAEHKGMTASARAEYRGLYWRPTVQWLWSSEDFRAPIGFFRRAGTSQKTAALYWVPRPSFWGLRDIRTGPALSVTTTPKLDEMLTLRGSYDLEFNWRNQWRASATGEWERDKVRKGFSLYEGFGVAPGEYDNAGVNLELTSPSRLMVSSTVGYRYGTKFGGIEHSARWNFTLRLGSHLSVKGGYGHRYGHLGDSNRRYNFGFFNGQTVVSINRNLSWDTLVRLNFAPQRELFDIQSRLRWRYRPGSDIYLVYARHNPLGAARPEDPMRQSLALKANFFFAAPVGRRR